jgi:hypothetical protein
MIFSPIAGFFFIFDNLLSFVGISESQMEAVDEGFTHAKYRYFTHNPCGHILRDPGFNSYE